MNQNDEINKLLHEFATMQIRLVNAGLIRTGVKFRTALKEIGFEAAEVKEKLQKRVV